MGPVRTKAKITDDKGCGILVTLLADNYVLNKISDNDYGVDYLVNMTEVNHKGDKEVSGKMFFIQLKSSESSLTEIKIKKSTIDFWNSNNNPIFLITVNVNTQDMKFINVKKYLRENRKLVDKKNYETHNMKFSTKNTYEDIHLIDIKQPVIKKMEMEIDYELLRGLFENSITSLYSNLGTDLSLLLSVIGRDEHMSLIGDENDFNIFYEMRKFALYISSILGVKHFYKFLIPYEVFTKRLKEFPDSYNYLCEHDRSETYSKFIKELMELKIHIRKVIKLEKDYWVSKNYNVYDAIMNNKYLQSIDETYLEWFEEKFDLNN